MAGKQWAKARDGNELEIVKALRKRGVPVYRIESTRDPGVFDLLCEMPDPRLRQWRELASDIWLRLDGCRTNVISRAMDDVDELICMMREDAYCWVLLEVKDPRAPTSNNHIRVRDLADGAKYHGVLDHCEPEIARKLLPSQADFLLRHRAPRYVVTSIAEALRACGLEPETEQS